ncbi:hypothetical protein ACQBAU_05555 [Propionibacteriaceae bacterium Y2011]
MPAATTRTRWAGTPRWVWLVLPWLAMVVGVWLAMSTRSYPIPAAMQLGYFALGVALPGTLAWKSLSPRGSLPELVALGSTIGLLYELIGWAWMTAVGIPRLLPAWSLLLVVVLLLVPVTRRRIFTADTEPLPLKWHWSVAAVAVLTVLLHYRSQVSQPVPTHATVYYPDLVYYLGMVEEATNHFPMQTSQVAGTPLQYHWFVYAHMAAAGDWTGLDPRIVVFRTWMAPMLVVFVIATAALARKLTAAWWTGPLAAALLTFGTANFDLVNHSRGLNNIAQLYLGPTSIYATYASVVLVLLLVRCVFSPKAPVGAWVLLVLVGVVNMGGKPTTFPMVLGGLAVALLVAVIARRDLVKKLLAALLVGGVMMALALRFLTGSSEGTPIRLFGVFRLDAGYTEMTGDEIVRQTGTWIVGGLVDPSKMAIAWATLVFVNLLVALVLLVLGVVLTLIRREDRGNPLLWFLLVVPGSAMAPYLLLDQPAYAEVYFIGAMAPFTALVAIIFAARSAKLITSEPRRWALAGLALLCGGIVTDAIRQYAFDGPPETRIDWLLSFLQPWAAAVLVAAVAVVVWRLLGRRWQLTGGVLVLVLALSGGVMTSGVQTMLRPPAEAASTAVDYTRDEQAAADWIREHTPTDAVLVTPTACRRIVSNACDARGFLISGIAGRRAYMEGWGYLQENYAQQYRMPPGTYYPQSPSPWPDRVALTEETMTDPTPETIDKLRAAGVTWIFTNDRVTPEVKQRLGELAELRHQTGTSAIYEVTGG